MTARLSLPSRLMALQYKVNDRMRHRRAYAVASQPVGARDFSAFAGARQALLVTFKRSGEAVPTPVNVGLDGGKLYFRSEPHASKVRRLRRDPRVRVCPCSFRGKPRGPVVDATARVVSEAASERAYEIVAANWRADMALVERGYDRIGVPAVFVELTPA
jgi:PPOX class probable F420-dependent enzyme